MNMKRYLRFYSTTQKVLPPFFFFPPQNVLQLGHRGEPTIFRKPHGAGDLRRRNPGCCCSVEDRAGGGWGLVGRKR